MYWWFHIQPFFSVVALIGLSTADWTLMQMMLLSSVTLCSVQPLWSMEIWTAALIVLSSIDSHTFRSTLLSWYKACLSHCPCSRRDYSESACVLLTCLLQLSVFWVSGHSRSQSEPGSRGAEGKMRPWVRSNRSRSVQVRPCNSAMWVHALFLPNNVSDFEHEIIQVLKDENTWDFKLCFIILLQPDITVNNSGGQ